MLRHSRSARRNTRKPGTTTVITDSGSLLTTYPLNMLVPNNAVPDRVGKTRVPVLVTRFGKPGAQIVPPPPIARDDGWLGCTRGRRRSAGGGRCGPPAKTYGQPVLVYSGPSYRSMAKRDGAVVLRFDHADGLMTRAGEPPDWFEIAGDDRQYVEASAVIDGETVVVSGEAVPDPVAVRFAWHTVAEPNLVNGAGLPAGAFRTHRQDMDGGW